MSSSNAGAAAFNAGVQINGETVTPKPPRTAAQQDYLDELAEQAKQAVPKIEAQIEGLNATLVAAKAEAKRARAEAQDEVN